ncbi:MAG: Crp/Fnr family transcriptional regulator [Candidatus Izemoplasmatales bacterium]
MEKYCKKCQYNYIEGNIVNFPEKKLIFLENAELSNIYTLIEGYVKMIKILENGDERILGIMGPGDFLALLALLQGKNFYIASAETLTPVVLNKIDRNDALRAYQKSDFFRERCLNCAVTRSNLFQNNLVQSTALNTKERIINTLLSLSEKFGYQENKLTVINLPFSKTVLANLIGIARETLSRNLTILQKQKVLEVEKNKYILLYVT